MSGAIRPMEGRGRLGSEGRFRERGRGACAGTRVFIDRGRGGERDLAGRFNDKVSQRKKKTKKGGEESLY